MKKRIVIIIVILGAISITTNIFTLYSNRKFKLKINHFAVEADIDENREYESAEENEKLKKENLWLYEEYAILLSELENQKKETKVLETELLRKSTEIDLLDEEIKSYQFDSESLQNDMKSELDRSMEILDGVIKYHEPNIDASYKILEGIWADDEGNTLEFTEKEIQMGVDKDTYSFGFNYMIISYEPTSGIIDIIITEEYSVGEEDVEQVLRIDRVIISKENSMVYTTDIIGSNQTVTHWAYIGDRTF